MYLEKNNFLSVPINYFQTTNIIKSCENKLSALKLELYNFHNSAIPKLSFVGLSSMGSSVES